MAAAGISLSSTTMAWSLSPGWKPHFTPKYRCPAAVAKYSASGTVRNAAPVSICLTLDARIVMAVIWAMESVSPPATSLPRATWSPRSSISRTGAVPLHRFQLDAAQWTAHTPARFIASCSRSSLWTQWAMRVPSFHRPYLS